MTQSSLIEFLWRGCGNFKFHKTCSKYLEVRMYGPFCLFLVTGRVKIDYKFLLLSGETPFNLQTGDVKGAESSSSGRNVEWTCSRELVLHPGESTLC